MMVKKNGRKVEYGKFDLVRKEKVRDEDRLLFSTGGSEIKLANSSKNQIFFVDISIASNSSINLCSEFEKKLVRSKPIARIRLQVATAFVLSDITYNL